MSETDARVASQEGRIKIAFCITELDPGGAEWALFHIVSRFDRNLWEPRVYSLSSGGELVSRFEEQGISVRCFSAKSSWDLRVFSWLKAELHAFEPEIVQGFLFHGNVVSRIAGYQAGVPLRFSGHRVAEREKTWHLSLDRLTKRFVNHHVCVSKGVADFISRKLRLPEEAFSVIPNGVDSTIQHKMPSRIREELGLETHQQILLAVGRLHRQKGYQSLLKAFQGLVKELGNVHLLIVGEGPERRGIEEFIRRNSLEGRVTLTGFRSDVAELMLESDLFVLSSLWEGMPNVVLQAMSLGLPVVATDVEGVVDVIADGKTGRIVKSGDSRELLQAMRDALEDENDSRRMAELAKSTVLKEFTWDSVARKYQELYLDHLGKFKDLKLP